MLRAEKHRTSIEQVKCDRSARYFIHTYCMIEEPKLDTTEWIPFHLWPFQTDTLRILIDDDKILILKARQLGLTWLVVAVALHLMLFTAGAVILIFSAGDTAAVNFLERIKGMHTRLPEWLQSSIVTDNDHELELGNGSRARSFASTKKAGRSFTGTMAILDEADWIEWFKQVMNAVKPTIDNGGKMVMLSSPDKDKPHSPFKNLWRNAQESASSYTPVFLSWQVHPHRDDEWYQQQIADAETIDDVHQEYPSSPEEALSGRASSKRFNSEWIDNCRGDATPIYPEDVPAIPGLTIYRQYAATRTYAISVDTCEGDPTSDPSPATVFCIETWEEVAHLFGRFEPDTLAGYIQQIGYYYGEAVLCVERNNHGHAVHLALHRDDYPNIYQNPHDDKDGWLSSSKYKTLAVNNAATCLKAGDCVIHTQATRVELLAIDASTLAAPSGGTDDRAMTLIIGLAMLRWPSAAQQNRGGFAVKY